MRVVSLLYPARRRPHCLHFSLAWQKVIFLNTTLQFADCAKMPGSRVYKSLLPARGVSNLYSHGCFKRSVSLFSRARWSRNRGNDSPPAAEQRPWSETWHGRTRVDEFGHLQDLEAETTRRYWQTESKYANSQLEKDGGYLKCRQELRDYVPRTAPMNPPDVVGRWAYTSRWVDGRIVYVRSPADGGKEEVLLDTRYIGDPSATVTKCMMSDDQTMLAYLTCRDTEEQGMLHIRAIEDGSTSVRNNGRSETLRNVFGFVWAEGHRSIYYTTLDDTLRASKVHRHVIGTPQSADTLIYHEKHASYFVDVTSTKDKKYITISCNASNSSEVWVVPADPESPLQNATGAQIVLRRTADIEYYVDHHMTDFYLLHNYASPKFVLGRLPSTAFERGAAWRDVEEFLTTEDDERIEEIDLFKDFAFVYVKNAGLPALISADLRTGRREVVNVPEPISVVVPNTNMTFDTNVVKFKSSSPLTMQTMYAYNMEEKKIVETSSRRPVGINPDDFDISRILVPGNLGVRIPVTVIKPKRLQKNGRNPVNVRGYGAYGVSMDPHFRIDLLPLLRRGFIVSLAHVRGGGELGSEWYNAGRLENKANSFADCVSVAEYFIDEGWTTPALMTGHGVSAGGLLMATVLNQRPDLFRAMVLRVPFVDPLSAMLDPSLPLTIVERQEWGDPVASASIYDYIASYAPYDNIPNDLSPTNATSILITASLADQRVSLSQALKYVARMRARNPEAYGPGRKEGARARLLLRVLTDRAHSAGGNESRIEDAAVECSFYFNALGLR